MDCYNFAWFDEDLPGVLRSMGYPWTAWMEFGSWVEPCEGCGDPVEVTAGMLETVGAYHSGCFGWPMCSCESSHTGQCPPSPH